MEGDSLMDMQTIVDQAVKSLKQRGNHPPLVIVEFERLPKPVLIPIVRIPPQPSQLRHTLFLMGKQAADQYRQWKILRVWYISEAWMSVEPHGISPASRPSQDPKRREVLVINELDATTEALAQKIEIQEMYRNKSRKITNVLPLSQLSEEGGMERASSAVLLNFLAGFMEVVEDSSYGPITARILEEKRKMEKVWRMLEG
jgi:hypothetical protein